MQAPDSSASAAKIGLALSGGGFRAALFHVGVLARLAELGILRRVEVISSVSGGSIIGALYYIHVKNLLESKPDSEITDEDYVELVETIHREFREGIQKNLRARAFLNIAKNVWMAKATYSRSDRLGDLYDKFFYKPAWGKERPKRLFGLVDKQIAMSELKIHPPDEPAAFRPDEDNARRTNAKVPVLLVNATTLNTGHNWRFEAVRMGEPLPDDETAREVYANVDKNLRLEPGYFEADTSSAKPHRAIASAQRDFPLAVAVAASACVPGLFHPLSITGLYSGIRVQLVDGGVHDNQGLQGLFDSDCTHLIVSDASGQLTDQPLPATRIPGVGGRANSILADRVRDEQLAHASERPQPIALMHLRKGLVGEVSLPLADDGKPVEDAPKEKLAVKPLAGDFGISMDAQRLLSRVRTDLDSFSDTEAFALMLDAYSMTDFVLNRDARFAEFLAKSPPVGSPVPERWDFRAVEEQTGAAILPGGVPSPAGGRPAAVLQADLAGAACGHGPEGDRCGDPDRARCAADLPLERSDGRAEHGMADLVAPARARAAAPARRPLRQGARAVLRPLARPRPRLVPDADRVRAAPLALLAGRGLRLDPDLQPARAECGLVRPATPRVTARNQRQRHVDRRDRGRGQSPPAGRAPSYSRPARPRSCPSRVRARSPAARDASPRGSLESRSTPISTVRIPNIRHG